MMLKRNPSQSKRSAWSLVRAGLAGLAVMVAGAATTAGCLDRPVAPAGPRTSNVYVSEIRQTAVDKIDLLFMIDNSISMADKQAILADAVPLLVQRLITPICIKSCGPDDKCTPAQEKDGIPMGGNSMDGKCPAGTNPEFQPINDIHIGVVTSSLGSHGASNAKDVCITPTDDDHAYLLGDIRNRRDGFKLQPYDLNGFLKWDPKSKYTPAGDKDGAAFTTKFTDMVTSAGEHGCGYEASLESWYRFLIDPEPPAGIAVPAGSTQAGPTVDMMTMKPLVDGTLIAQRGAFLRGDSLVAVVMLSDENDCSIVDEGYGWLIARSAPMYRSTSQCATNPNDPCCQSCGEEEAHANCPPIKGDSECAKGNTLAAADDDLNLRCWQQKRRFGFELLYPTTRYSDGLKNPLIKRRSDGMLVENPLYKPDEGKLPRDPGLVFLAGIVGVPWQDIADEDSLKTGDSLRYLTEAEMEVKGRWATILGLPNADPGNHAAPVLPLDPLMIETPVERTGMNPVTMDALAPATSMDPQANKINGHEQANMGNRDLQYACIFPLSQPLTCDQTAFDANKGCDCFEEDKAYNRPLCQPKGGGAAGITQNFAKAYPGLRHLQVLKEFKDNSIVASICPKVIDDPKKADYGYNPAVKAIIDRLKEALKGKCLPRPLVPVEAKEGAMGLQQGQVPCAVIEAVAPAADGSCSCNVGQNRLPLDVYTDSAGDTHPARPQLRQAVLARLNENNNCSTAKDAPPDTRCDRYCTCELAQLSGTDLKSCQNDASPPAIPGYCYINAAPNEPNVGSAEQVKNCSADSKRLLRFVGGTPAQGAIALVACLGASLGSTSE